MRLTNLKTLALASAVLVIPFAQAQYSQGPQPYSSQDPQNYGSPASQSYSQGSQDQRYDPRSYDYDQGDNQAPLQTVSQAPPPLPDYEQPEAPGEGYIWTPGYWAFGPGGYYWVGGAWVEAPYRGALWTPGYWGFSPFGYAWNVGYWGPTIGYYGGINYGFGYFGSGFCGGYWLHERFFYNREYAHISRYNHDYYNQRQPGIITFHPRGSSFTTDRGPRGGEARGGTFNRVNPIQSRPVSSPVQGYQPNRGGPGSYSRPTYSAPGNTAVNRGGTSQAWGASQTPSQRPGLYSGQSYGGGRPSAPQQQYRQPVAQPQQSYRQPAAPQQQQQSYRQPSAPQQSFHPAPSGGGGFGGAHSGGGFSGGGGHVSGGHR